MIRASARIMSDTTSELIPMANANPILEYDAKIQSGEIPASAKLKAVYAHIVDHIDHPGRYYYDAHKADTAIDFIENFLYVPKLSPPTKMRLQLWQRAYIATIFGMIDAETGLRQYREAFLYVGRKNAKSCLSAAIAIYVILCDGEPAAELYCAATNRFQSRILWNYAKLMIKASPTLSRYFKIKQSSIDVPSTDSVFIPLSKDSGSLDGLAPSCILIDELHAIQDANMYEVLQGGTYSRRQPLTLITSTGGHITPGSIFEQKYNEYRTVIDGYEDGSYVDETVFPCIYELDDKNEINDERAWIKANPNLGISKRVDILRAEVNRSRLSEQKRNDILSKQFNVQLAAQEAFFDPSDVIYESIVDPVYLDGAVGWGGFDLGATRDLTAATVLVAAPGQLDHLYVLQMFWIAEDTLQTHIDQDEAPYDTWIDQGLMRTTPGSIVDVHAVLEWFEEVAQTYNIQLYKFGYDRFYASYLVRDMQVAYGADNLIPVAQNFKGLSSQMYLSKTWFQQRRFSYGRNPLLQWNLLNVQATYDNESNVKPSKNRNATGNKIDGYASLLDAFCVYLDTREEIL